MAQLYTVDASVFLNAFNSTESGHEGSAAFLVQIRDARNPIVVPTLLLPEVAATIARGREDAVLARSFAEAIRRLPGIVLVPLDEVLASEAANVAAAYRLRGSDAVYAAVALRFNAVLVTRDLEQRARVSSALTALSPEEALSNPAL